MMRKFSRGFALLAVSALFGTVNAAPELMAYWSFDSVSGNTYYDVTGHGYNATSTGTNIGIVSGLRGNALSCTGSGFDCSVANSRDSFCLNTFTVEAWYYPYTIPISGQNKILTFDSINNGRIGNGYTFYVRENGVVATTIWPAANSYWVDANSSTTLVANKWYHLVGTYDGNLLRTYINGTLEATVSIAGGVLYPVNAEARIGCEKSGDRGVIWNANGKIDELKLYNYALPADSILAHYNALKPSTPPPPAPQNRLMAYWSFDSVSGNTDYDVTGHGYNATSTGSNIGIAPGISGCALSCTGSGFDCSVANSKDSFCLNTFTIEAWYYANSIQTSGQQHILTFDSIRTGVGNGYNLCIAENGFVWMDIWSATTNYWVVANSITALVSNKWYHLVGTYDGSYVRTYVNGNLEASVASAGGVLYPTGADARIGCEKSGDRGVIWNANGKIDELKLYNYALPVDSILAHYNAPKKCVPIVIPYLPRHTCDRKPCLRWHPAHGNACDYTVQINTTPDFTSPFIADAATDTAYSASADLPLGNIYWRVGGALSDLTGYSIPDTFLIEPVSGVTGINSDKTMPTSASFSLLRRGIAVNYLLEKQGVVSLNIFTIAGNRIATLYKGNVSAGKHSLVWDGTDKKGKSFPAGSYIAAFRINNRQFIQKIVLTR